MRLAPLLAIAAWLTVQAPAQVSRPSIVATCDVAVLDAASAPIPNLVQSQFEVLVDGEPVPVRGVSLSPSTISVILIIDGTASQPLKRYEVNSALATQWLPSLTAADRIRIGVVGAPLTLTSWLSPDPRAAVTAKALVDRAATEPSPLWDAAAAAIDALAGESNQKLILIVSDGRSNANVIGLDEVAERALASGVVVSSVGEGGEHILLQAGDDAARIRPNASLQWLAQETGGVYLPDGVARRILRPRQDPFAYVRELIATPSKPGPLLVSLTSAMRQRYRLSFAAPSDGRVHRLDVRTSAPGATVHVRKRFQARTGVPVDFGYPRSTSLQEAVYGGRWTSPPPRVSGDTNALHADRQIE